MKIKDLFDGVEGGALTYEQFEALVKENGAKFADLSEGKYVSTSKYDADLKAKDKELEAKDAEIAQVTSQVENLNSTIATRDTDLDALKAQLEAAGQDATKLAELNEQLTGLKSKYEADVQSYQAQMQKQAYEFAVKDFASTKKFTSQAAKRDFIQSMIAKGLQMDGDKILGREDFAEKYAEENADAFVVDTPVAEPPVQEQAPEQPKVVVPEFVAPTPGPEPTDASDGFQFNFTGVRAH